MDEQKRVRMTFVNCDQHIDIWLTPDELKRMLTHADAYENRASQKDVDRLTNHVFWQRLMILLIFAVLSAGAIAIAILWKAVMG